MSNSAGHSVLDELPGEPLMWILIVSELLVFGAGLMIFLVLRLADPEMFATSQDSLNRVAGGVNTIILITSGFAAAMAMKTIEHSVKKARLWLGVAMGLGVLFLVIKWAEYAEKARHGIDIETNDFFTFYYLLTGFHAAHVMAGLVIFALLIWKPARNTIEAGAAFWHMVDLVWVLLFPIIYLLR